MAIINRSDAPPVALPEEVVPAPALGGDVVVRGMDMPQAMRFNAARRRLSQPLGGETEDEARERAAGSLVPLGLAMCVVDNERQPIYSESQWAALAAREPDTVLGLWGAVLRLSGQQPETEKKA